MAYDRRGATVDDGAAVGGGQLAAVGCSEGRPLVDGGQQVVGGGRRSVRQWRSAARRGVARGGGQRLAACAGDQRGQ